LDGMVEPTARGDPESPLRWTCKSARALAAELTAEHHPVSHYAESRTMPNGDLRALPNEPESAHSALLHAA